MEGTTTRCNEESSIGMPLPAAGLQNFHAVVTGSVESARARVAFFEDRVRVPRVKLVKRQINGNEHVVLKENASAEDLRLEAVRLKQLLGYEIEADERLGCYLATHHFYRGKFIMSLEPD